MLLKDSSKSRNKNTQELVKASVDALVKALEAGHSDALSAYRTAMSQFQFAVPNKISRGALAAPLVLPPGQQRSFTVSRTDETGCKWV
jgi:hypothetical protein